MQKFETRDFLAVIALLGYIVCLVVEVVFLGGQITVSSALRDFALIIVSYYFGTKSALDQPAGGFIAAPIDTGQAAPTAAVSCPYAATIIEAKTETAPEM